MRSLKINHVNHHQLKKLAELIGKPLSIVAEEAINEWMETNGEPILKALERRKKESSQVTTTKAGRLLNFPARRKNGRKPRRPGQ